jgi:hypothetical protein
MPEAEAAAAGQAAGSTRARHSTQGSTTAGITTEITAEGAATTAGTIKPPPHGRVDKGLIITIFFSGTFYIGSFPQQSLVLGFDYSGWNSTVTQFRYKKLGSQEAQPPDLI